MDEFQAPENDGGVDQVDLDAAPAGYLCLIGGGILLVAGLTQTVAGVQLLTMVEFYSFVWVVPWVMIGMGIPAMALGGLTTQARDWAAMGAVTIALMMAFFNLVWTVFALFNGFISPLGMITTAVTLLSVPFTLLALPSAIKSSRAKRQLYS